MLAYLFAALLTGFVIVFVVPLVKTNLEAIPAIAAFTGNRFVQLIFVGAIALAGLGFFTMIARRIRF
jgi:hypothetical protein